MLGLLMAALLNSFSNVEDYFPTNIFMEIKNFSRVNRSSGFRDVYANIRKYSYYDHEEAAKNPICHSSTVLDHLAKNSASVISPIDIKSLN